jgi:hypothetical protein
MIKFNDQLSTPTNARLISALENNKPIFKENGGEFTSTDVDLYLSEYELLNNVWDDGLISDEMLYNAFSYSTIKTTDNVEIKAYLQQERKTDSLIFAGFQRLAESFKEYNNK